MPLQNVPAEEFMHVDIPAGRVRIYCTYKGDLVDELTHDGMFSLCRYSHEDGGKAAGTFDVEELPELRAGSDNDPDFDRISQAVQDGFFNDWPHFKPEKLRDPDKNGNHLHLRGYACPRCRGHMALKITGSTTYLVHDETVEEDPDDFDDNWDEHSQTECVTCGHHGELGEFSIESQENDDDEEADDDED